MVHKPKHKVHSFRGLLGDGGQDEIVLERQNLNVAYRIVKFHAISYDPTTVSAESVVKIYREEQSGAATATIDFSDSDLLGVALWSCDSDTHNWSDDITVIFDNVLFSRNIYVTHQNTTGGASACNYYIEIEEVPVSASALMQLKLGVARKLNLTESPADA